LTGQIVKAQGRTTVRCASLFTAAMPYPASLSRRSRACAGNSVQLIRTEAFPAIALQAAR
jgi:hypothetical protein